MVYDTQVLTMCVSSGHHICLICLLLYGCHTKADTPDFGTDTSEKYAVSTVSMDVNDEAKELYFMEKDFFLKKLMTKYGNGEEMSFEGFEHLLHKLGLGGAFKFDHEVSCHRSENSSEFLQLHSHHNHSMDIITSKKQCGHTVIHSDHHDHVHRHDDAHDNHKGPEHIHDHKEEHDHIDEHNHDHIDEHNHDDTDEHSHEHDHADEHNHEHINEHNHDHTDEHNHDHTDEDNNHKNGTDGNNHDHDHTDDHIHDHKNGTDEHNHDHTDDHDHTHEHNHDHADEHNHDHTDDHAHEHNHDHTDEHDHANEHTDDHNHDHTDDHNHDHTDDHADEHNHDHADEHNHDHDHTDDHNHDHGHTDDHNHDHTDDHNHDHDHTDDHSHDHDHTHVHKREADSRECLSASVMLRIVSNNSPKSISKDMFKELCPNLIYQIEQDSCHSSHGEHSGYHDHGDHDHGDHDHDHDGHDHSTHAKNAAMDISKVSPKVWGYSAVAVIIISLVGLLGVAVIPIMQKVFYNHMLQFLVALAVGALSGDALLHLFPHAIAVAHDGHDHSSGAGHSHDTGPIYKGLCGLLGIYFFFFTERVLTMFTEFKRKKKQKKNRAKKCLNDEEMMKVGEKLANSECDGMMMSIHPNRALRAYADETHTEHCTISFENSTSVSHEHGQRKTKDEETCVDGDENSSMIHNSSNASPKHHGHGHSHGVDGVPNSVASVAWMVIMGDGIHNFCDGLAIGAAFVNSITGGFSTSIAVFCHELPHEIGDFAMLLRAGMSPKQAIIYNCLSSILCFIGMLIGVAVGNMEGATLWVFAMVGGMFLYIALVDMLPELSSVETKKGEHPLCHLLLQGIGMFMGAGIMLAIALYEGELMTVLD